MLDIVNKHPSVKAFDPGGEAEQPASLLSQVLQAVAAVVASAVPLRIVIEVGGSPAAPAVPVAPQGERAITGAEAARIEEETDGPHLTPMEQIIIGVLTAADKPLKQLSVARRAGKI